MSEEQRRIIERFKQEHGVNNITKEGTHAIRIISLFQEQDSLTRELKEEIEKAIRAAWQAGYDTGFHDGDKAGYKTGYREGLELGPIKKLLDDNLKELSNGSKE